MNFIFFKLINLFSYDVEFVKGGFFMTEERKGQYTIVDRTICIPCGVCSSISNIYKEDKDGFAFVECDHNQGTKKISKEKHLEIVEAKESCPTGAVKTSDFPFHGDPDKFEPIEMKKDETDNHFENLKQNRFLTEEDIKQNEWVKILTEAARTFPNETAEYIQNKLKVEVNDYEKMGNFTLIQSLIHYVSIAQDNASDPTDKVHAFEQLPIIKNEVLKRMEK